MTIQNLHNLIHQLTSHEQMLVRYALKGAKEDDENKYRQLFDFVAQNEKNLSSRSASLAIYRIPPDTRINKLISRLWEKILDIITSDNFLRKNTKLNERSLSRINSRKKMLQYATLGFLTGTSDVSRVLIEQGIRYAEKSEYYLLLTELYKHKKNITVFSGESKEYDFCEKRIQWYKGCLLMEEDLLNYYNELTKENGYGNTHSPKKKMEYLEKILGELKRNKKYIVSVYSKFIFCLIQLDYLLQQEDYASARKLLQGFLRKFGNAHLDTPTHITARMVAELCNCELLTGNYTKGITYSEKSLKLLWTYKKLNYYIQLERLFLCVFFSGDFARAKKITEELLAGPQLRLNNFRIAKPAYYRACIHFKEGEYKPALKIINSPLPLNNEKTGYNIAIRILRIQCLLALNRFDEASGQIDNLRKHISRNQKKTYTSERLKLITRTLVLMQKRGFSGRSGKEETALAAKLSSSGEYKWSPLTHELIRFHEWYKETEVKK